MSRERAASMDTSTARAAVPKERKAWVAVEKKGGGDAGADNRAVVSEGCSGGDEGGAEAEGQLELEGEQDDGDRRPLLLDQRDDAKNSHDTNNSQHMDGERRPSEEVMPMPRLDQVPRLRGRMRRSEVECRHDIDSFTPGGSRREHGSSGELDVFGATSYFAGLLADDDDADLPIQANKAQLGLGVVQHDNDDERRRRHAQAQLQVVAAAAAAKPSAGKTSTSKLAALLSFVAAPSPRSSFRKEPPPRPLASSRLLQAEAGDDDKKPAAKSRPSSSSWPRESRGGVQLLQGYCGAPRDDDALDDDLGVATGDRRLQGVIRVVRGRGGGGEETWVVRCAATAARCCWDDDAERQERKALDDAAAAESSSDRHRHRRKDDGGGEADEGDGGDDAGDDWQSDSSSDLFDLDIDCIGY